MRFLDVRPSFFAGRFSKKHVWGAFLGTICLGLMGAVAVRADLQPDLSPLHLFGSFPSHRLANHRAVTVLLPPGYEQSRRKRYPVVYLADGQNVFDARDLTFFHKGTWQVDTISAQMIRDHQIEPVIVVAIDNTSARADEYTPDEDTKYHVGGKADIYGQFLVEEVKPFVDSRYRTLTGPQDTALAGSSLGGLATLAVGLAHPDVFGKLAVLSPSVFWADHDIIKRVDALATKPKEQVIYLYMGTGEGDEPARFLQDARSLRDHLTAKGWALDRDLLYEEGDGEKHDEPAWARRVPHFLRFFFPAHRGG